MRTRGILVVLALALSISTCAWGADLLAEIRSDPVRTFLNVTPAAATTAFPLFYSGNTINQGCALSVLPCLNATATLGTDLSFSPTAGPTFVDYTSPAIDNVVGLLTNGADDLVAVGLVGIDSSNLTTSAHDFVALPESQFLFGVQRGPDLAGARIDFIRLLVLKADIATSGSDQTFTSNVVWQFYSGQPVFDGGGQSAEVDALLTYVSPLQRSTSLPAGTTAFPVKIVYGATINPSTLQATLNGVPAADFIPAPGASQALTIPLVRGRNTLKLQVSGTKSTDQDTLVFLVP